MENVKQAVFAMHRGVLIGIHGVSRGHHLNAGGQEDDLKESFERLRKSLGATAQAIALNR
ncbi:MAG: hypothetical protein MZV70_36990 [Desulfobacterales bacterium]|nr:hypothetical protein [Desulfobacterales bacterium]